MTPSPTDSRWLDAYFDALRFKPVKLPEEVKTLYCVTEGDGYPIKIGLTRLPDERITMFQMHTCHEIFVCWQVAGTSTVERALKHIFHGQTLWGEWFSDPSDEIKSMFSNGLGLGEVESVIERLASEMKTPLERERGPKKASHTVRQWAPIGRNAA